MYKAAFARFFFLTAHLVSQQALPKSDRAEDPAGGLCISLTFSPKQVIAEFRLFSVCSVFERPPTTTDNKKLDRYFFSFRRTTAFSPLLLSSLIVPCSASLFPLFLG